MTSIGASPAFLMFGFQPKTPYLHSSYEPDANEVSRVDVKSYIKEMELVRKTANDWAVAQRDENIDRFNKSSRVQKHRHK